MQRRSAALLLLVLGCGLGGCANTDSVAAGVGVDPMIERSALAASPATTVAVPPVATTDAPPPATTPTTEAPRPTVVVTTPVTAPPVTRAVAEVPEAPEVPEEPEVPSAGCDPSYPGVCIPPAPPDLDCPQISYRRFAVVGADPHRFDADNDGIGCESG